MLKVGDHAPDFRLPDQAGTIHNLKSYAGAWLLLYFYPEDDTSGCTKEACGFRDALPHIQSSKLTVLGISPDSVESHGRFAEKYHLPFSLLADAQKEMINAYGVWREKQMEGKTSMGVVRVSFLIDPDGKIAKIYDPVKPEVHAEEVLADLERLQ